VTVVPTSPDCEIEFLGHIACRARPAADFNIRPPAAGGFRLHPNTPMSDENAKPLWSATHFRKLATHPGIS
jgi:hypothetical protein